MTSKNFIDKSISKILESKSLRELADNLDQFLNYLKKEENKFYYISDLYDKVRQIFIPFENLNEPYIIFKDEKAVLLYLYLSWNDDLFHSGAITTLNGIIRFLRENTVSPQGPQLSSREIDNMLNHLERRFQFKKLALGDTLFIALLNDTHIEFNSFYLTNNSDNIIRDAVFLTHPRHHFGCPQQHTLLHEIGHLLHIRTTNTIDCIPASFQIIQKIMFAQSFCYSAETVSEVFADCFSLAATINTDLEQSNPLNPIHPEDKMILYNYFALLINTFKGIPWRNY